MMKISQAELFRKYAWTFFDQSSGLQKIAAGIGERHFFVTGATGLFGSWLFSFMDWCHDKKLSAPQITALVRRDVLPARNYSKFLIGDLNEFSFPKGRFDRLIHLAAPSARDTFNGMPDREKLRQLYFGTNNVLKFASKYVEGRCLFTSAGAVYGAFSINQHDPITELNRNSPPSSMKQIGLGLGKRVAEFLIADYVREGNVDAGIARCFSFIGPGLPTHLHYAVGNFVYRAVMGENIVINGDGTPIRSFMHLGDAIYWLLTILEHGKSGEDFNVGSEEIVSIAELAKIVRDSVDPRINVEITGKSNISPGNPLNHYYVPNVNKAKIAFSLSETMSLRKSVTEFGSYIRELTFEN